MSLYGSKSRQQKFMALAMALTVLLLSAFAFAAGRIEWANKKIKSTSDNNAWKIELKVYLPRAPDVPSVPSKFVFQQTVYFERSMVDGDKLIVRDVPMEGKQPIVESVDIGFLDPRTGKIENRTQFSFKLHRDHGFECGRYKVTVRDARNDSIIGQPTEITLDGENEVIDRRSVVFSGEKKKKVDSTGGVGDAKKDEKKTEEAAPSEEPAAAADPEPAGDDRNEDDAVDAEKIKTKPGGCGCRVPGSAHAPQTSLGLFGLVTALLLTRRLRRGNA
jgi:hypothetical protein